MKKGSKQVKIILNGHECNYVDEDVKIGETYRYELTLIVSGKELEPVAKEVTINALPELPGINAVFFVQGGLPRLSILDWPEDVSEVMITKPGRGTLSLTHEEYNSKSIFFNSKVEAFESGIQAVRRFGARYTFLGPLMPVKDESRKILTVALTSRKASLWSRSQLGMVVTSENNAPLPELLITIGTLDGPKRQYSILVGEIFSGEFYAFPSDWHVKRGERLEVTCSDGVGQTGFIVRFLTFKTIS